MLSPSNIKHAFWLSLLLTTWEVIMIIFSAFMLKSYRTFSIVSFTASGLLLTWLFTVFVRSHIPFSREISNDKDHRENIHRRKILKMVLFDIFKVCMFVAQIARLVFLCIYMKRFPSVNHHGFFYVLSVQVILYIFIGKFIGKFLSGLFDYKAFALTPVNKNVPD